MKTVHYPPIKVGEIFEQSLIIPGITFKVLEIKKESFLIQYSDLYAPTIMLAKDLFQHLSSGTIVRLRR